MPFTRVLHLNEVIVFLMINKEARIRQNISLIAEFELIFYEVVVITAQG